MTNQPPAAEPQEAVAAPPVIAERGIVARGQRIAIAMNDAPREFLARAPLVVLPATGYTWRDYQPVLEHFAGGRRVLALDWPGFGGSAKPDWQDFAYDAQSFSEVLAEWMDAMGIGRAVLLGNGLGGNVALRYAAAHPQRALGLALVAPQGFAARGPFHQIAVGALSSPVFFSLVDGMLWWLALGPATPAAREIVHRRRLLRQTADYAAYEMAAMQLARNEERSAQDLLSLAREVQAPALVVRGALDPLFTAADARKAAGAIGEHGALGVVLPGAGHLPFLQEPVRFYQAVEGLLTAAEMQALEGAQGSPEQQSP
jgi:pimeloyl-ACP methyl ester carboxylesterase